MRIYPKNKFLAAATVLTAFVLWAPSAHAQYWNSYGWGLGSSLLYPLSYLPYRLLYGSGNGYGSSGYALNNVMNQTYNAPYGYLPYGGKFGMGAQQGQPYSNSGQYSYGQPNQQGQAQSPNNTGNYDPNNNQPSSYQTDWQGQVPPIAPPSKKRSKHHRQPLTKANSQASGSSSDSIASTAEGQSLPPIAPDLVNKEHSLFADGFFQVVNTKFGDDMSMALKDKEMYSWAQALNLVDRKKESNLNLSAARKETIEKILKDDSLDSQSKMDTLKILLK